MKFSKGFGFVIAVVFAAGLVFPSQVLALTQQQIGSVISLLQAFDASPSSILSVKAALEGKPHTIQSILTTQVSSVSDSSADESVSSIEGLTPVNASASATAYVGTCRELVHTLYRGKKDATTDGEVSELQKVLKNLGHYDYPEITGYFGTVTEDAVKKLQREEGLATTGSYNTNGYGGVGPKTRALLLEKCKGTPKELVVPARLSCGALGDINKDGTIDVKDKAMLVEMVKKDSKFSLEQRRRGDINGDGKRSVYDISLLIGFTSGENTKFPGCLRYRELSEQNIATASTAQINLVCGALGDVNGDGYIETSDAQMIQNYSIGKAVLSSDQKTRADVNRDGDIDFDDTVEITKYLNKESSSFSGCTKGSGEVSISLIDATNQTIESGTKDVLLAKYQFSAGNFGEDVSVVSVNLPLYHLGNDKMLLSNCYLHANGEILGGSSAGKVNPRAGSSSGSTYAFNVDNSLALSKGGLVIVQLRCDVGGTDISGTRYYWGLSSATASNSRFVGKISKQPIKTSIEENSGPLLLVMPEKIVATPTITVVSPNGGEVLVRGEVYEIKWTSSNVPKFNVQYINEDTGVRLFIINNVTGNTYSWIVPETIDDGLYRMKVDYAIPGGGTVSDSSDSTFTIGSVASNIDLFNHSNIASPYTMLQRLFGWGLD